MKKPEILCLNTVEEVPNPILKYFKPYEFECHCGFCGCGWHQMNYSFLKGLDTAREAAGIPFVITSGYRCEVWNEKIGGVETSPHMQGYAADIAVGSSYARFKIVSSCLEAGFERIGIGSNFIHVDNDPRKHSPLIWTYYNKK